MIQKAKDNICVTGHFFMTWLCEIILLYTAWIHLLFLPLLYLNSLRRIFLNIFDMINGYEIIACINEAIAILKFGRVLVLMCYYQFVIRATEYILALCLWIYIVSLFLLRN